MMRRPLTFIFLFLFIGISPLFAQEFLYRHPTCQLKYYAIEDRLQNLFLEQLKTKGYQTVAISEDRPLLEGDIYAQFTRDRLAGKIFKDCQINVTIKQALKNHGSSADEVIHSHTTVRSMPRLSFRGHERCTRAMRDVFVHIPPCHRGLPTN